MTRIKLFTHSNYSGKNKKINFKSFLFVVNYLMVVIKVKLQFHQIKIIAISRNSNGFENYS